MRRQVSLNAALVIIQLNMTYIQATEGGSVTVYSELFGKRQLFIFRAPNMWTRAHAGFWRSYNSAVCRTVSYHRAAN